MRRAIVPVRVRRRVVQVRGKHTSSQAVVAVATRLDATHTRRTEQTPPTFSHQSHKFFTFLLSCLNRAPKGLSPPWNPLEGVIGKRRANVPVRVRRRVGQGRGKHTSSQAVDAVATRPEATHTRRRPTRITEECPRGTTARVYWQHGRPCSEVHFCYVVSRVVCCRYTTVGEIGTLIVRSSIAW